MRRMLSFAGLKCAAVLPLALCCVALLAVAVPCYAQSDAPPDVVPTEPIQKPAPVSDRAYATEVGGGRRENYLDAGLSGSFGYIDNLYPGSGTNTISEKLYTLLPTLAIDTSTLRQHLTARYSPSFILYQPSSGLNEVDQNALFHLDHEFTPRLALNVGEAYERSSTGFGQAGQGVNGNVTGTAPTLTPGVYVPFASRTINQLTGQVSYEVSPHGVAGGSGQYLTLSYPNLAAGSGLYNSSDRGGDGFLYERLSAKQFLGGSYAYQNIVASPPTGNYRTDTNTFAGFYTLFLADRISVSISGGPQHYSSVHAPSPAVSGWSPSYTVSGGWQGRLASFAGNYSHTVTGGGGLLGAFRSTSVGAIGRWQMTRSWTSALSINYASNTNATPLLALSSPSGHSVVSSLSLQRALTTRLGVRFQYDRIQESFQQIQAIAANPTSNRGTVTLVWELRRPLGR